MFAVALLATANPGKVHRATPRARRNRRNIAGNKDVWRKSSCVYGIFPYCKQSFRRDVRRNFASGVYTLRRFDELSLPSSVSFLRCTSSSSRFFRCASSPPGLGSFQFERTLRLSPSLATFAYRIRIALYGRSPNDASCLDIARCTRTCPYRFWLNHRDVNARVDKIRTRLREMLTHAVDDAQCHDRGFGTWLPVILSVVLVQRNHSRILRHRHTCIFKRASVALIFIARIRGLLLYASRFHTANAFTHVPKSPSLNW